MGRVCDSQLAFPHGAQYFLLMLAFVPRDWKCNDMIIIRRQLFRQLDINIEGFGQRVKVIFGQGSVAVDLSGIALRVGYSD